MVSDILNVPCLDLCAFKPAVLGPNMVSFFYQLLNEVEYHKENYADRGEFYPPRCKTASEICIIHTKRKASSIIVSLFIQNTSKFLTTFPLRRLSSKL